MLLYIKAHFSFDLSKVKYEHFFGIGGVYYNTFQFTSIDLWVILFSPLCILWIITFWHVLFYDTCDIMLQETVLERLKRCACSCWEEHLDLTKGGRWTSDMGISILDEKTLGRLHLFFFSMKKTQH